MNKEENRGERFGVSNHVGVTMKDRYPIWNIGSKSKSNLLTTSLFVFGKNKYVLMCLQIYNKLCENTNKEQFEK